MRPDRSLSDIIESLVIGLVVSRSQKYLPIITLCIGVVVLFLILDCSSKRALDAGKATWDMIMLATITPTKLIVKSIIQSIFDVIRGFHG